MSDKYGIALRPASDCSLLNFHLIVADNFQSRHWDKGIQDVLPLI